MGSISSVFVIVVVFPAQSSLCFPLLCWTWFKPACVIWSHECGVEAAGLCEQVRPRSTPSPWWGPTARSWTTRTASASPRTWRCPGRSGTSSTSSWPRGEPPHNVPPARLWLSPVGMVQMNTIQNYAGVFTVEKAHICSVLVWVSLFESIEYINPSYFLL